MNEALVVLVRSLIAFFTLLIFARILGKQQISQLTFFDYVVGISIGSIAATLSVDLTSRAWPHWIGLLVWAATALLFQLSTQKFLNLNRYINGEPTLVIADGKIMEKAMKSLRYTLSDLLEQLRDKGVFDLKQVAFAVVETNGQLSVLLKPENLPVTPSDLNLNAVNKGLSSELIYDGLVIEKNLQRKGLERKWLDQQLKNQGIASPAQVFVMTIDDIGTVFIDRYEDHMQEE